MPAPYYGDNSSRPLLILGSLVLGVAILYWAQSVIIPLILAMLLAFILSPAVHSLQQWGLRRVPSVILVVLLALMLLGSIGLAISYQIRNLASEVPELQGQIAGKITAPLQARTGGAFDQGKIAIEEITKEWGYSLLRGTLVPVAEGLATTALVIVLLIFILIGREDLRNRLVRLAGRGQVALTTRAIDEASQRISKYLLTQLLINAMFGAALGIGLALIGVPYALFWGFLGALLRFVPYLGVWLAALLVFGFSIAVFGDWAQPLIVFGLFAAIEVTTFNVVEPLLFGHSTGISPVVIDGRGFLDLAVGSSGIGSFHSANGLPGRPGQVCPPAGILQRPLRLRTGAGCRSYLLSAPAGSRSGRSHRVGGRVSRRPPRGDGLRSGPCPRAGSGQARSGTPYPGGRGRRIYSQRHTGYLE